jgi:tetratricopeptide (TPR) repeat protein
LIYCPPRRAESARDYRLNADFQGASADKNGLPARRVENARVLKIRAGAIPVPPFQRTALVWRMIIFIASLLTGFAVQPDAYQLNSQGRDLLDQHRYAAAVRVFRRAVDKAETGIGPDDPATAMILRNLALAYVQSGDTASAEQTAKLALAIIESRFGRDEPGLTPVLNVLAECYAASGRMAEAQRASQRAVSIGPEAGVHYGIALHNMGALREYSGDAEDAASFYRRAIAVKSEMLGAGHPHVALSKAGLRRVEQRRHLAVQLTGPIKLEKGE